ncbi:MAG: hypothetical protein LBI43_03765 [Streptococcaceae bacterium]|nr:hypothetical protein [Streptococcaceae bacterium]
MIRLRKSGILTLAGFLLLASFSARADTSSDLQSAQNQYAQTASQIKTLNTKSQKMQVEMAQLDATISSRQTALANQARSAQTNGQQSNLLMQILSSSSLSDAISKAMSITTIMSSETDTLKQQQQDQETLSKDLATIQTQQTQAQLLSAQLQSDISSLQAKVEAEKEAAAKAAAEAELQQAQAAAAAAAAAAQTTSTSSGGSSTPVVSTPTGNVHLDTSSGGINLAQTSGMVNPSTLANYMAANVGGAAATWYHIIIHESGGNVAAQNPYSSAYGVFQCLNAPRGSSLGTQIQIAAGLYHSQGFYGAWLRWE